MLCQPEDGRNRKLAQHAAPLQDEKMGTACRAPTNSDGVLGVKIGILAVQGDFAAHAARLAELGAETVEVRTVGDLDGCDGLILPGGESTTQLQ